MEPAYDLDRPARAIAALFGVPAPWPEWTPPLAARPGAAMPLVRRDAAGRRRIALLRWGLVPGWARNPGLAAEGLIADGATVAAKPMFGQAFRRGRRCLAPMRAGVAAGLWEIWTDPATAERIESFCLVARAGTDAPALLPPDAWPAWLGERAAAESSLLALLKP